MARSLFKGRLRLILSLLLVLVAILFLWHRRNHPGTGGGFWHHTALTTGAPFHKASGWVLGLPERSMETARRWFNLKSENERLVRELRALQTELLRQKGIEAELAVLKSSLPGKGSFARGGVQASLIAQDASTWNRSFVIDAGSSQGVAMDRAVVSTAGVVGRVWSVSEGASRILSILDPASSVSGINVRSRVKGLAKGTGRNRMMFEYVNAGSDIETGDLIVTSGLGGVFPKNLPVGTVVRKTISEDGLSLIIELAPSADFGALEHVFVLDPDVPWAAKRP